MNYETSPLCWKCGAPMKVKAPPAPPVSQIHPDTTPEPPAASQPAVPDLQSPPPNPQHPAPLTQPSALGPQPSAKPAEIEAAALKDKDYVTPPVEVEERPSSFGEWLAYGLAAVGAAGPAFKQALDDYDARRGRKSGGMSSYGCVMVLIISAIIIVVLVMVIQFMARGR